MTVWQLTKGLHLHIPVGYVGDDQLESVVKSINNWLGEFGRIEDGNFVKPSLFWITKRPPKTVWIDDIGVLK